METVEKQGRYQSSRKQSKENKCELGMANAIQFFFAQFINSFQKISGILFIEIKIVKQKMGTATIFLRGTKFLAQLEKRLLNLILIKAFSPKKRGLLSKRNDFFKEMNVI